MISLPSNKGTKETFEAGGKNSFIVQKVVLILNNLLLNMAK